ncbi:MAG: VanZ family protein [Verrucomicrobia bacterium]|nr:VanZ family protein [Verrucomicrobiota bacterium]MCF7708259.1 VanZ family protein [Verrucomicrobiota bacterium]
MALVYAGSTEALSGRNTSRILAPVLRWIAPGISDEGIARVQFVIRKAGHLVEYAILAVLLWRAFYERHRRRRFEWSRSAAFWAFAVSLLYAISDEFHQSFYPSRGSSLWDVLIDAAGAGMGLGIVWAIGHLLKRW